MLRITLRGLRSHLVRLLLTGLVVVMGVAFVSGSQVLTDSVREGFDQVVSDRYATTDAVVRSSDSVFGFQGTVRAPIRDDVLATVRGVDGVASAEGVVQVPVRVLGRDGRPLTGPGGVDRPTLGLNWMDGSNWHLVEGRPPGSASEVVIDQKLATDEHLALGDHVKLPLASGTADLEIVGVARFATNADYSGSSAVLLTTPAAQEDLVGPGQFSWIAAKAVPGVDQDELRRRIERAVLPVGGVEVLTGTELTKEDRDVYQRALGFVNDVLQVLGYIALFVSSFVIYNTFSLIITQRTRQLALLRALGAGRGQIVRSVVTEATLVGVSASIVGVGAGIVFGALISRGLAGLGLTPASTTLVVAPLSFLPALVMGVVVTLAAGFFPAVRAARVPPVAALRDLAGGAAPSSTTRVGIGVLLTIAGAASLWLGLARSSLELVGLGMAAVFLGVAVLGPVLVGPASGVLGRVPAGLRGVAGVLARENARRNPRRTAATTSAIMIGVALVTLIAILGESVRTATTEAVDRAVVGDFIVNSSTGGFTGVSPDLTRQLGGQPTVAAAASFRVAIALADGEPTLFFGIDPGPVQQVVRFDVPAGSLDDLGTDGAAVSSKVAEERHLSVGSPLKVHALTPGGGPDPATAGTRVLIVKAIFDSELFRGTAGVLVSQALFEETFPATQQTDLQIYVKVRPGLSPADARAQLRPIVAGFPPAELQDLTEFKRAQTEPIDRLVTFIWALLLLAVLIAVVGILNTLLLSVYERTRELGLLRAAGMSRSQVRVSVRWEAVIIAILGTLVGLTIGVAFAWALVRALADEGLQTFAVPTTQLLVILVLAGVIGVIAASVPARRAANLDVLAAIATE